MLGMMSIRLYKSFCNYSYTLDGDLNNYSHLTVIFADLQC